MLKKYKKFQNVLLGLNALVLIILILVPMFNLIFMNSFEDMVVIWAVVTIIFLEIVIMVVQNAYENKVDKATYGKKSQEFVQEIKPIVKSEIEYLFQHINIVPWDAWGVLKCTDEVERLKKINRIRGI